MAIPLEAYLEVLPHHPVRGERDLEELQKGFQQATVRFEERALLPWRGGINFRSPRYAGLSLGGIDRVWGIMEGLLEEPFERSKAKVEASYAPESLIEMLRDAGILETEVVTSHLSDLVSRITTWGYQEVDGDPYVNSSAASGLLERMGKALERPDSLARTYGLVPSEHPAHFRQLLLKVSGNLEVLGEKEHDYFRDLGYQLFIQDQPLNPFDHMVRSNQRGSYSRAYCEGIGNALLERGNTEHARMYLQKVGLTDQEIEERLNVAKNHQALAVQVQRNPALPEQRDPEISEELKAEWIRQATRLAGLFAKELGMSEEEYMATLPPFYPQPEAYKRRLDIPLIVQPATAQLPLERILQIIGIVNNNNSTDLTIIKDWLDDPKHYRTPKGPYTTWAGIGRADESAEDARDYFESDERGGTVYDGIALYLKDPTIVESGQKLILPGSEYNDFYYAYSPLFRTGEGVVNLMFLGSKQPWIGHNSSDNHQTIWFPLIAGREITYKYKLS